MESKKNLVRGGEQERRKNPAARATRRVDALTRSGIQKGLRGRDLNPRLPDYESGALPLRYPASMFLSCRDPDGSGADVRTIGIRTARREGFVAYSANDNAFSFRPIVGDVHVRAMQDRLLPGSSVGSCVDMKDAAARGRDRLVQFRRVDPPVRKFFDFQGDVRRNGPRPGFNFAYLAMRNPKVLSEDALGFIAKFTKKPDLYGRRFGCTIV